MGRSPFHSLRSFHYERPIFPLLLTQLLQKQRYTTDKLVRPLYLYKKDQQQQRRQ
jgi:hypothetical protein